MKEKRNLFIGIGLVFGFVLWTALILTVDVKPLGVNGTEIGFSTFNIWFHKLTGVHMSIYTITDWISLVPIAVCLMFAIVGFVQLLKRRSIIKADADILALGVYYIVVIGSYVLFEMIPINYRPILIEGFTEASYPSSTTLLVLSVMPTLAFMVGRKISNKVLIKVTYWFVAVFSAFVVIGRLVSGVHWFSDIVGGVLLSLGLYLIYKGTIQIIDFGKERKNGAS